VAGWGRWDLIAGILNPSGVGIGIDAVIEVLVGVGRWVTFMAETYSSSTLTILH